MIGIPGLAQMTEAVSTAFKGTWAQMTEIFLVEHDEDGKHTDITAHSITTTPNTAAGATGDVEIGGDLTVDGLVGPLDFGTAAKAIVLDGTVIGPETIFDYSAFPSGGATADTVTGVLRSVRALTPVGDGTADLGYEGDTLRRWRNVFVKNLVECKFLHATTGLYERSRSDAVGEWITFTPTRTASAGTWTGGTVTTARYTLVGKTMTVALEITGTAISTAAAMPRVTIPGGFTSAAQFTALAQIQNAGAYGTGLAQVTAAGTLITFFADTAGAGFTGGGLNSTVVDFSFEVS